MDGLSRARSEMVETLVRRGLSDRRVLDAMAQIPRERFVAPALADIAYCDGPLPIGGGQTISQPYIVAFMAEAARLTATSRVLEVGGGCGYAAAVLGLVCAEVVSIERDPRLAAAARRRLAELGAGAVSLIEGDGALGCPERAPFDAILVAAAAKAPPQPLLDQLVEGGRLIIPVGGLWSRQRLLRIIRETPDTYREERLADVRFVPLI